MRLFLLTTLLVAVINSGSHAVAQRRVGRTLQEDEGFSFDEFPEQLSEDEPSPVAPPTDDELVEEGVDDMPIVEEVTNDELVEEGVDDMPIVEEVSDDEPVEEGVDDMPVVEEVTDDEPVEEGVDDMPVVEEVNESIVDIAAGNGDFSTLVELLTAAELVETLQGDGPFTVFAPTNDAFAALDEATLEAVGANPDLLTSVLLYHVLDGEVLSSDLVDGAVVATLNGADVTISLDPVRVNEANVVLADLIGTNGVVHVIDAVLIPPGEDPPAEEEVEEAGGEIPGNDVCEDAQILSVGETVSGSIVDATTDIVMDCAGFVGGNSSGVWYKAIGTGAGMGIQVNATFDVEVAVFAGSCGSFVCLDGTAGSFADFTYAEVTGAPDVGVELYLYVTGWEGVLGDFEVTLIEGEKPVNSECVDAPLIELGESVSGTTEFARIPRDGEIPVCSIDEIFANITSETVWYQMVGTGEITQLSLFGEYDSKISIYAGDNCDELECVNSNDDSPAIGPTSVIAQPMEEGQTYYILVHGFDRESGSFTLESEILEPAENDDCTAATPLELGVNVSSNTLAATGDEGLPFCGLGSNASSPGVWYSFEGTGNTMQVRLGDTILLHFSIYTGDCGDLTCAANQFFGFLPLTWDSVEGEVYSVFVYGRERALSDTFDIVVDEVTRPENDMCEAATELVLNDATEGTTAGSSSADGGLEVCGDVDSGGFGGVWYTFTGTGEQRAIAVNSGGAALINFFDTQISVYSGASCEALTCVGGADDGIAILDYENSVVVATNEGETYYVLVNGYGVDRGDFSIALLGVEVPPNDSCGDAVPLELGDTLQGTTFFASQSDDLDFGECGTSKSGNSSAPGVWYSLEGGGFPVQVSVFAEYDMQLTIMSGESCETLACLDGTEGNENDFFNGQVIFDAEEGATYWAYVHGFNRQVGDFEIVYETAIF